MKKAISILICLLFLLTILYPAGIIISSCMGYVFELISVSAFAIALAALSVCTIVIDIFLKFPTKNKVVSILLAVLPPLSLINAMFYIVKSPKILVIASIIISIGCCFYLTIKHVKPSTLKIISLVMSALMVIPIIFLSFIALIFGNFGQNTVLKTVESPNGHYYAQVIDSDQGAHGGNTFVDVLKESGINTVFFKIQKKPQRIYSGNWGEFENMKIYWKDDNSLIINGIEYEIK